MGSDRARASYNPHREYDTVLKQQGRVRLDADWNEADQVTDIQKENKPSDAVRQAQQVTTKKSASAKKSSKLAASKPR
jgi:hypothetical protein